MRPLVSKRSVNKVRRMAADHRRSHWSGAGEGGL